MSNSPIQTVGVIADTHVPDRINKVSPDILSFFETARVDVILHAGDISSPAVIEILQKIAPVFAVQGNRDWAYLKSLPLVREINLAGVKIGLTHGHGGWRRYIDEKWKYIRSGYNFEHVRLYLVKQFPRSKVIVFGHTHRPENIWLNGQLLFNPGAAYPCKETNYHAKLGLLRIFPDNRVEGEIISISNASPPLSR
jgi:putative phosphoesterase